MYFPYLRGRQFELIALRELVEKSKLSKNIIPIIEPVKVTSTLFNTIKTFNDASHRIAIIKNPEVGSFLIDSKKEKNEKIFNNIEENLINDNIYFNYYYY